MFKNFMFVPSGPSFFRLPFLERQNLRFSTSLVYQVCLPVCQVFLTGFWPGIFSGFVLAGILARKAFIFRCGVELFLTRQHFMFLFWLVFGSCRFLLVIGLRFCVDGLFVIRLSNLSSFSGLAVIGLWTFWIFPILHIVFSCFSSLALIGLWPF